MGRKLNHPTPTVINTELVPLDESFYIEASGELEQWYYDNSKQFAPNRVITPLTLTPMLSVFDKDTSTSYTPSFYTTRWFVNEYNATQGEYVESEIVNPVDGSSPEYIISGNNLLVKKNVSYTRSVTIRCEATYIDPRDSGVTYTTRDSVILTCNHDATVVFPDVAITSPKARSFNPLTDYKTVEGVEVQDSQFDFDATITNNPEVEEKANDYLAKYEVDGGGTEELVAQDDSITSAPTMQIRYPDGSIEQDATFVKRATAGGTKPTLSGEAVMDSMKGNTVKFNQLYNDSVPTAEEGHKYYLKENNSDVYSKSISATISYTEGSTDRMCIDLTDMFGTDAQIATALGIEESDITTDAGVAAFDSWLDANVGTYDYYPYTEGSLISVNIKSIKTTDSNDDTLDEIPFDITQIKGKLLDASGNPTGNSVVVFPDGLRKAGNVYDEIKVENGQLYAVKRIYRVDFGTFKYNSNISSSIPYGYFYNDSAVASTSHRADIISDAYNIKSVTFLTDKSFGIRNNGQPFVVDSDYDSATAFRETMAGKGMLYVSTTRTYILDPIENTFLYKWFGISNGQEVDATTMPWYVSGQNTSKLKVDAMFGESINVVLRAQMPDGTLSPSKAYAGVEWRIPDIDTNVLSNNGGAVRSDTTSMTFDTVINVKGDVLADARKQQHLRFNWKYRKNTNTTENDAGWGNSVTINASNLRNVKGASSTLASTLVYPYVYVLGAWQTSQGTITGYDKPTTTKDGVTYYRIIDD